MLKLIKLIENIITATLYVAIFTALIGVVGITIMGVVEVIEG